MCFVVKAGAVHCAEILSWFRPMPPADPTEPCGRAFAGTSHPTVMDTKSRTPFFRTWYIRESLLAIGHVRPLCEACEYPRQRGYQSSPSNAFSPVISRLGDFSFLSTSPLLWRINQFAVHDEWQDGWTGRDPRHEGMPILFPRAKSHFAPRMFDF